MASTVARETPHDIHAEKAVLGAVMMDNACIDRARAIVVPADFFRDDNGRIFQKSVELRDRAEPVDPFTLNNALGGLLDASGGIAYLTSLTDGVPRTTNVESFANIVKEKSTLRKLIAAANGIVAEAYGEDLERSRRALAATFEAYGADDDRSSVYTVNDALDRAIEFLADDGSARLRLGLDRIDHAMKGLALGELLTILARTASGKTNLSLALVRRWVYEHPALTFLIVNAEMPMGQTTARLLRMESGLSEHGLRRALAAGQVDIDGFRAAFRGMRPMDQGIVTIDEIAAAARRLERAGETVGAIIIDHAGLVRSTGNSAYERATSTAIAMKQLARSCEVAVIGIVQANRVAGQGKDDEPVALEAARDSGAYEENADFCLGLSKLITPTDGTMPYVNARLTKNRRGPCVPTTIMFDPVSLRMNEQGALREDVA